MYNAIQAASERLKERARVARQIMEDLKKLNEQEAINEGHRDEYRSGLDRVDLENEDAQT